MAGGSLAVGPGRKSVLSAVGVRLIQMDHPLVLPANPRCTSLPDSEAPSVRHELPAAVGFGSHNMYKGSKKVRKVFTRIHKSHKSHKDLQVIRSSAYGPSCSSDQALKARTARDMYACMSSACLPLPASLPPLPASACLPQLMEGWMASACLPLPACLPANML